MRLRQGIERDRPCSVGRIEVDHLVNPLIWNVVQDVFHQGAMGVNHRQALPSLDIGDGDVGQEGRFAHPGLPQDVEWLAAVSPLDAEAGPLAPLERLPEEGKAVGVRRMHAFSMVAGTSSYKAKTVDLVLGSHRLALWPSLSLLYAEAMTGLLRARAASRTSAMALAAVLTLAYPRETLDRYACQTQGVFWRDDNLDDLLTHDGCGALRVESPMSGAPVRRVQA